MPALQPTTSPQIDEAERQVRVDLAACYRLVAHFGWDDLIYTHISAHVPGRERRFLINPLGMMFDEIRASDLVVVDLDGVRANATDSPINEAGFVIHSAVHAARPDVGCVLHLHTPAGMAVSALKDGLLPLNQSAMGVAADLAFHDFEGPALHLDERERLVADLGAKNTMILRNHGTLAVGATVAEAFHRMYFFERACATQALTLSMGQPLNAASPEAIAATEAVTRSISGGMVRDFTWPALLRMLDRKDSSYRD
nr:class II aldolase/adducin family protein [uncultured Brevundimonas sp.]